MLRKSLVTALSALACLLSACGPGVRADASKAIAGFLGAAQRDDRKAFEATLDRAALRADLSAQVAELGRSRGVDVDGGASEFAMDRMITPQAVGLAAARTAPGWPATPTPAQVVPHMKVADRTHACLEEAASHRCLLTFMRRDGVWRLVGMLAVQLQPDPTPSAAPGATPAKP